MHLFELGLRSGTALAVHHQAVVALKFLNRRLKHYFVFLFILPFQRTCKVAQIVQPSFVAGFFANGVEMPDLDRYENLVDRGLRILDDQ